MTADSVSSLHLVSASWRARLAQRKVPECRAAAQAQRKHQDIGQTPLQRMASLGPQCHPVKQQPASPRNSQARHEEYICWEAVWPLNYLGRLAAAAGLPLQKEISSSLKKKRTQKDQLPTMNGQMHPRSLQAGQESLLLAPNSWYSEHSAFVLNDHIMVNRPQHQNCPPCMLSSPFT